MKSEKRHYFTQEDLKPHLSLPTGCNWQEMTARREVLAPPVLITILKEANNFLITQPGPNLARRKILAPSWFNTWQARLHVGIQSEGAIFTRSEKLLPFDQVGAYLREKSLDWNSGVLFVAGAEGHEGHIFAANYMANYVRCPIWVFEQDDYLQKKDRKAPFLPLEVRLSMWHHSRLRILTVSPQKPADITESEHYKSLFKRLGATYSFADSSDPYVWEKVERGVPADYLIVPHQEVERTTDRVEKLMPDISDIFPERATDLALAKIRAIHQFSNYFRLNDFWEV